jgi:hypothetical protein
VRTKETKERKESKESKESKERKEGKERKRREERKERKRKERKERKETKTDVHGIVATLLFCRNQEQQARSGAISCGHQHPGHKGWRNSNMGTRLLYSANITQSPLAVYAMRRSHACFWEVVVALITGRTLSGSIPNPEEIKPGIECSQSVPTSHHKIYGPLSHNFVRETAQRS